MKIVVSFATEDFVTPEHDDVILRLAELLSQRNIRGSFHLTGEYARKLRQRCRVDVIQALKKHEIGYHSNTHGAFPFIAEICENNSWDDAVSILARTEAKGIQDIADIFDVYPEYYVIEFVKAPQLIYALRCIGVDAIGFSQVPASGSPFSWYIGSLCFSAPYMGVESPPAPGRLEKLKKEFDGYYEKAQGGKADGVIKIFNHPYKFLYNNRIASWGSENRIYRDYRVHRDWAKPESSMYDKGTVDHLFNEFAAMLDYVLSMHDVRFLGTTELMNRYRLASAKFLPLEKVIKLARQSVENLTFHMVDGCFYSPAEIFALVVYCLNEYSRNNRLPQLVPFRRPLGPVKKIPEPVKIDISIPLEYVLGEMAVVDREIDFHQWIPSEIIFGDSEIPLGSCCKAFGALLLYLSGESCQDASKPETVVGDALIFGNAPNYPQIAANPYFQEEIFTKKSYPEGFTGSNICRHCRLQSWTYKPAIEKDEHFLPHNNLSAGQGKKQ